jgi:hypothetical protein
MEKMSDSMTSNEMEEMEELPFIPSSRFAGRSTPVPLESLRPVATALSYAKLTRLPSATGVRSQICGVPRQLPSTEGLGSVELQLRLLTAAPFVQVKWVLLFCFCLFSFYLQVFVGEQPIKFLTEVTDRSLVKIRVSRSSIVRQGNVNLVVLSTTRVVTALLVVRSNVGLVAFDAKEECDRPLDAAQSSSSSVVEQTTWQVGILPPTYQPSSGSYEQRGFYLPLFLPPLFVFLIVLIVLSIVRCCCRRRQNSNAVVAPHAQPHHHHVFSVPPPPAPIQHVSLYSPLPAQEYTEYKTQPSALSLYPGAHY